MKKFYKIIILLIVLIFLTTYNPNEANISPKKNSSFFTIQNIEVVNNSLVQTSEIREKLNPIYKKNIFFVKRKDIEEPLKSIDFLEKIEVKKYIQT